MNRLFSVLAIAIVALIAVPADAAIVQKSVQKEVVRGRGVFRGRAQVVVAAPFRQKVVVQQQAVYAQPLVQRVQVQAVYAQPFVQAVYAQPVVQSFYAQPLIQQQRIYSAPLIQRQQQGCASGCQQLFQQNFQNY